MAVGDIGEDDGDVPHEESWIFQKMLAHSPTFLLKSLEPIGTIP
jgi:hypothetical protein